MDKDTRRKFTQMFDALSFDEVKEFQDKYYELRALSRTTMRLFATNAAVLDAMANDIADLTERIELAHAALIRK